MHFSAMFGFPLLCISCEILCGLSDLLYYCSVNKVNLQFPEFSVRQYIFQDNSALFFSPKVIYLKTLFCMYILRFGRVIGVAHNM